MDKELIDRAWAYLPKEFKEEVKKLYLKFYNKKPHSDCSYGYIGLLIKLFSIDNLISDAEGEEMLTVPRKDIVELYQEVQKTISQCKGTELAIQAIGTKNVLWSFFGSKCLSDEEQPKQKDCDNPSFTDNCQSQCKGQDHLFDPTKKTDINYLRVAGMILGGIIAAPIILGVNPNPSVEENVRLALHYADVLIAECGKGKEQ